MDLRACILQNAEQYARGCNETALKSHDIKMKSPILFVLFGQRVEEGLEKLKEAMQGSVLNAEGIIYLVIGSKPPKACEQVVYLPLEASKVDKMTRRSDLGRLIENEAFLRLLGEKITYVKKQIMAKSRMFSFWQQMHICTVTMASDEENVLLDDIMIFIKNKFMEEFKQIFMDLFVILQETAEDAKPLNKAYAMSLFKEIEKYETPEFHYEKETEVLEDDLRLKVSHEGQLFELVYILSDKNESGQKIEHAEEGHFETIAAINLLKNPDNGGMELEEAREQFNLNVFEVNIKEQAENRYCSSRLAKVKKPGSGIYLAIAYHLFKLYLEALNGINNEGDNKELLRALGLSDESLSELVNACMPEEEMLRQFHSLIAKNVSFNSLKSESFREAETQLYGQSANSFFEANFKENSERKLNKYIESSAFKEQMVQKIINNPMLGPFTLKQIKNEVFQAQLSRQREKYQILERQLASELEEAYEKRVGERIGGKFGIFDKKYLYEVKDYLVSEVYTRKYKIISVQLRLRAMTLIMDEVERFYHELTTKLQKLERVEILLKDMMEEVNRYEEAYLVQNVNEYYMKMVKDKLEQLKVSRGEGILHEEHMMGSVSKVLDESEEDLLRSLFMVIEKEILNDEKLFNTSFEEELLARANMRIDYEEKQVAAKSDLYDLLYKSLEENSRPCVHLDTMVSPHRYIEKYFFGDRQSEFIQYAYKRDQSSRSYKIGTVSNARKTMIEKLQLMGGFKLQELVFYAAAERYYEAYKEKGYIFH